VLAVVAIAYAQLILELALAALVLAAALRLLLGGAPRAARPRRAVRPLRGCDAPVWIRSPLTRRPGDDDEPPARVSSNR
jgi:hypothetical protein